MSLALLFFPQMGPSQAEAGAPPVVFARFP